MCLKDLQLQAEIITTSHITDTICCSQSLTGLLFDCWLDSLVNINYKCRYTDTIYLTGLVFCHLLTLCSYFE